MSSRRPVQIRFLAVASMILVVLGAASLAWKARPEDKPHGGRLLFTNDKKDRLEVLYDHDEHVNAGIKCEFCHEKIFKDKAGANEFLMRDVFAGKFCGACHSAKATEHKSFAPQKNCHKCHRVKLRDKQYDLEALKKQQQG